MRGDQCLYSLAIVCSLPASFSGSMQSPLAKDSPKIHGVRACVKCALKVACLGLPQMSYLCTQYVTRSRKPCYTCFSRQKPPPSQRHALQDQWEWPGNRPVVFETLWITMTQAQKLKRPGRSISQTNCYTLNTEAKYWSNSSQFIKMCLSSSVIYTKSHKQNMIYTSMLYLQNNIAWYDTKQNKTKN